MIFENTRIILVEPSHPGNIGSAARAMKTMGFKQLYLVNPKHFPHPQAMELAAGAQDILNDAIITSCLEDALQGSNLIFGSSARPRNIAPNLINPKEAARVASIDLHLKPAFIFGRESSGLTNEELQHCHYHLYIPANSAYSSLNLSHAVQIVTYELRMQNFADRILAKQNTPASYENIQHFYQHLKQLLVDIDFLHPAHPKRLMERIKRLFNRIQLEEEEVRLLQGMLTKLETKFKGK